MAEAQLTNQLSRIESMTNAELRVELKRRGCSTTGNKKDLLAKLRTAMQKEFDQQVLATASKTATINYSPMERSSDDLISHNDTSELNTSSFMTPTAQSPQLQNRQPHTDQNPYSNLLIHDPVNPQYSTFNLSVNQQQQIPSDDALDLSSSASHNTRRKRPSSTPGLMANTPETKRTRTREKKRSIDSSVVHFEEEKPAPTIEKGEEEEPISELPQIEEPTNVPDEQQLRTSTNVSYNIEEVNIDQRITGQEEKQHEENEITNLPVIELAPDEIDYSEDLTKTDDDRSRSPSASFQKRKRTSENSPVTSESVINEMPLSDERKDLRRSKSPKATLRDSSSPSELNQLQHQQQSENVVKERKVEENINGNSTITINKSDNNAVSVLNEKASKSDEIQDQQVTLFPEEISELVGQKENDLSTSQNDDINEKSTNNIVEGKKRSSSNVKDDEQKHHTTQQRSESKQHRSQTSALIKGLHKSNNNRCLNLSSDVLKTLIPDIGLGPAEVLDADLEAIDREDGERSSTDGGSDRGGSPIPINERELETNIGETGETMTIGELEKHIENGLNAETTLKQKRSNDPRRTVIIDINADTSSLLNDDSSNEKKRYNAIQPPARILSHESKPLLDGKTNALMMDEPMRMKDVTPSNQPATKILYIRGLTRPFTVPQLKELLSRYGTLMDGDFWVDKIKSQCFVTYDTLEEAQSARESLDGCRWPSSNPKTMIVRFAKAEELEFSKTHDAPPDQMPPMKDSIPTIPLNTRLVQEKPITKTITKQDRNLKGTSKSEPSTSNANDRHRQDRTSPSSPTVDKNDRMTKNARSSDQNNVREWDLHKLQPRSPSSPPMSSTRSPSTQLHTESNEPTTQPPGEAPAKVLDDYFRKTKSKPAVYWLPLTDEQALEKIRVDEQKKKDKADERKKHDDAQGSRQIETHQVGKSSRSNNDSTKYSTHSRQTDEKTGSRQHHRSISPVINNNTTEQSTSNRDKRKRLSPSPPSSKRENKRH